MILSKNSPRQFGKDLGGIGYRKEQTEVASKVFLELIDALGGPALEEVKPSNHALVENEQTREIFAEQARRIAEARHNIVWQHPSRGEIEDGPPIEFVPLFENPEEAEDAAEISIPSVAGSSTRGIILHKLMEEVLLAETSDSAANLKVTK